MTAASCLTALGALCGQLTFWLAWCREHSVVTVAELLQPWDLACGTLFRSSCAVQTSPTDCSDDSWSDTIFGNHEHCALWLPIYGALEKHSLTYLLNKSYQTLLSLYAHHLKPPLNILLWSDTKIYNTICIASWKLIRRRRRLMTSLKVEFRNVV